MSAGGQDSGPLDEPEAQGRKSKSQAMSRRSEHPGSIELAAGTTTVVFTWAGDRWAHEVRLADDRRWQSVEGPSGSQADPRWPAPPPLIEVSLAAPAGVPAVLGVGRAGRSHYSLCVVADADEADTLFFDVACRIHEPAGWLGSTYQSSSAAVLSLAADLTAPPPGTVRWAYSVGPRGILARPLAGPAQAPGRSR